MSNWVWFQDSLGPGTTSYSMSVDAGVYTLTGNRIGANLIASAGVYSYSGSSADLGKGYGTGPALAASYTLTGNDIGPFVRGHRIEAAHGEYHLTAPKQILKKTTVPVQGPAAYVETAWETLENEGDDLDAQVTVDAG